MNEVMLSVGQKCKIKSGFMTSFHFIYAGMTNDNTYSIVITTADGYRATAYNLYLPIDRKVLELKQERIDVLHVTPDSIRCRITKN